MGNYAGFDAAAAGANAQSQQFGVETGFYINRDGTTQGFDGVVGSDFILAAYNPNAAIAAHTHLGGSGYGFPSFEDMLTSGSSGQAGVVIGSHNATGYQFRQIGGPETRPNLGDNVLFYGTLADRDSGHFDPNDGGAHTSITVGVSTRFNGVDETSEVTQTVQYGIDGTQINMNNRYDLTRTPAVQTIGFPSISASFSFREPGSLPTRTTTYSIDTNEIGLSVENSVSRGINSLIGLFRGKPDVESSEKNSSNQSTQSDSSRSNADAGDHDGPCGCD